VYLIFGPSKCHYLRSTLPFYRAPSEAGNDMFLGHKVKM